MTLYEAAVRSLHEEVLKLLVERGWSVDRCAPLDEARASLELAGAPLHTYAEAFLRAFDGLQFHHSESGRSMKVSAADTCSWLDGEELPYVQALLSPSACPVALGAYSSPESSISSGPASGGVFPDCWYFVAEDGQWLCIDIYWGAAWFLPNLDAALRFALLNEGVQAGRRPLTREQCPPGTWEGA